jgi:hypothetical protein
MCIFNIVQSAYASYIYNSITGLPYALRRMLMLRVTPQSSPSHHRFCTSIPVGTVKKLWKTGIRRRRSIGSSIYILKKCGAHHIICMMYFLSGYRKKNKTKLKKMRKEEVRPLPFLL